MSDTAKWFGPIERVEVPGTENAKTHYIEQKRWRGNPSVPAEKLERARQMQRLWKSRNHIAKTLHISRASLWRYLGPVSHWTRRPQK